MRPTWDDPSPQRSEPEATIASGSLTAQESRPTESVLNHGRTLDGKRNGPRQRLHWRHADIGRRSGNEALDAIGIAILLEPFLSRLVQVLNVLDVHRLPAVLLGQPKLLKQLERPLLAE